MSDTRHREPWAVPDCPRCQSPVFVEGSPSHKHDWTCHSCEDQFSVAVLSESGTFFVSANGRHGTGVYHTDRDCERLEDAERFTEVRRRYVRRRGLRECKLCSGDTDSAGSPDRPCPICGAEEKGFAQHIRGCDGGGSDE